LAQYVRESVAIVVGMISAVLGNMAFSPFLTSAKEQVPIYASISTARKAPKPKLGADFYSRHNCIFGVLGWAIQLKNI